MLDVAIIPYDRLYANVSDAFREAGTRLGSMTLEKTVERVFAHVGAVYGLNLWLARKRAAYRQLDDIGLIDEMADECALRALEAIPIIGGVGFRLDGQARGLVGSTFAVLTKPSIADDVVSWAARRRSSPLPPVEDMMPRLEVMFEQAAGRLAKEKPVNIILARQCLSWLAGYREIMKE